MNLYEKIQPSAEETITILHEDNNIRVERIISSGQTSPEGFWYDQDENEWLTLVQGKAVIGYADGGMLSMKAGDTLFIPAGKKHRVAYTAENELSIWLCVFYK